MLITNMLNHQNNYLDVISLCFGTESLSEGEIQFFFSALILQPGVFQALEMPLSGD